jgi:hypothetical protein
MPKGPQGQMRPADVIGAAIKIARIEVFRGVAACAAPAAEADMRRHHTLYPMLRKLRHWAPFSEAEESAVLGLPCTKRAIQIGNYIGQEGDEPQRTCLLVSGPAYRHKDLHGCSSNHVDPDEWRHRRYRALPARPGDFNKRWGSRCRMGARRRGR